MNLPNKLTVVRIALVPVFAAALMIANRNAQLCAAVIFACAAMTDWADGYIARKRNLITNFGKLMDPIADKLLVMVALVGLSAMQRVPAWVTMVLLAREFIISGIRLVAAGNGRVIAADKMGKYKTTLQMIAIIALILSTGERYTLGAYLYWPAEIALYGSVVLSIWSLISYVVKNKEVIADDL